MNDLEFEEYLNAKVNENIRSEIKDAMSYSLMNGGKRVRPQLLFTALSDYGIDPKIGFPCACAIEMIHTYSLIHDDLPAMDNDDFRRGKPSCHKAFGEAYAILAGDGLLTKAFEVVLETECSDTQKVELVKTLSQYSGVDGMIFGQNLDIRAETINDPSLELILQIDEYKTAKLIILPLVCAAIIANKMEDIKPMKEIGYYAGLQFQFQDDILDVTQTEEALGKTTSDEDNNKMTAVSVLGLDQAKVFAIIYRNHLIKALKDFSGNHEGLSTYFEQLVSRTK